MYIVFIKKDVKYMEERKQADGGLAEIVIQIKCSYNTAKEKTTGFWRKIHGSDHQKSENKLVRIREEAYADC